MAVCDFDLGPPTGSWTQLKSPYRQWITSTGSSTRARAPLTGHHPLQGFGGRLISHLFVRKDEVKIFGYRQDIRAFRLQQHLMRSVLPGDVGDRMNSRTDPSDEVD